MSNKFLDDVGLKHLWEKALSTFAKKEELNNIGNSENILKVTATATPTSQTGGELTGMSHSFAEIQDAYDNGATIYFCIDVSLLETNTDFVMPLCVIQHNQHACCTTILDISGVLAYIQFFVTAGNNASFLITPVTSQSEQSGGDNTLKVTAELNPETMNAINPSHYAGDIHKAYIQGKTVTLHIDVSSILGAEGYSIIPLMSLSADSASFMGQVYMDEIYFFCATIFNDSISTRMEALQTK